MSRERVFLPFTSRCVRVTASNLARLSRWRSSSWEACPVTATIVVTERFDKNSLGHTVVTLGLYVGIHGDVADVPATVQILSTVQVGSVQSTEPYSVLDKFQRRIKILINFRTESRSKSTLEPIKVNRSKVDQPKNPLKFQSKILQFQSCPRSLLIQK